MSNINELRQANKLWLEGQQSQAISILENVNGLKQDDDVITTLIHFYVENKQFSDAIALVQDQKKDFVSRTKIFDLYFTALIKNQEFILARKELLSQKEDSSKQSDRLAQLNVAELEYSTQFSQTIAERERNFYHIGDHRLLEQQSILHEAFQLPFKNYVNIARYNLIDPFLNQITRVAILKELILLNVKDKIKFVWIDQKRYELIPTELRDLNEQKRRISVLIQEDLDPIQAEMLAQQANLMYDLSYPFPEKIFPTALEWKKGIVAQFLQHHQVVEFEKLNQIMMSMINE